jgi:hypothetical protein
MGKPSSVYPLSFSKMKIGEQCDLRYDYQYHSKTVKDPGSDASRFGDRVHKAFEKYLRDGEELPDNLAKFKTLLDKLGSLPGQKYYEYQMAVSLEKEPCDWWAKDCSWRAKIDLISIDGDTASVGDWKTGKPSLDTEQMKLTAALVLATFPQINTVKTAYFWLYHQSPPQTMVFTRDMLPILWAHFDKKADRLQHVVDEGVFRAKPSGLCPWCPAYEVCPSAKRRR